MGWFKNMFKKKPGGGWFGNLLRGVVSGVTGGIIKLDKTKVPKEFDLDGDGKLSDGEIAVWKNWKKTNAIDTSFLSKDGNDQHWANILGENFTPPSITKDDDTQPEGSGSILDNITSGIGQLSDSLAGLLNPKVTVETGKKTNTILYIALGLGAIFLGKSLFSSRKRQY
ncbi:hypothetical protein ACFS6H_16500 [Terrimonas rubra]|uniref:EF-hand domain-containing protein n=1 Tax=Terrimonas rubra TaxID=1035890 RepID=A0ABW6A7H6_9BACT